MDRDTKPMDTSIIIESAVSPANESYRRTMRKLKGFASAGRWLKLLLAAKKSQSPVDHPYFLDYQLRAALELGDEAEIKRCCAESRQIDDADRVIKLASLITKWKRPLDAAEVLNELPPDFKSDKARRLAVRLKKMPKDRVTRREVRRLISRFIAPRAARTETVTHRFPTDSENFSVPPSRIEVVRLDGIEPEIEELVKTLFAKFEVRLEQKKFPVVTEYRDVFTNELGMIWSADGSVFQAPDGVGPNVTDPTSVPLFETAFSCAGRHKGYFEWIVRRLSGLAWRLDPSTPDCPILLRKQHLSLAKDALGVLGIPEHQLIAIEGPVFCRRLYVGYGEIGVLPRRDAFQRTYGDLIAAAEHRNDRQIPRRFYISRRDSARRSMAGELEFETALAERGITPMVLSELGLLDKINLFRNAELVVGAHGAGLSHLVFAKPGVRVLEIAPTTLAKSKMLGVQTCFTRLSTVYGHHHTFVLQPMNPVTSEWSPNIADIDRVLAAG
ncbi:glycosyltransferase 61 family protein [Methylobacterium sp. 10]|uniref:glycosyltransferase 61 family protein n=1 Tax=Methylobacterium sp. 10 TaxID=1101191 RepID=UPI0009DDAB69|nr:glycosyltransferase 61 family protein [Methylobacterium sp. 10]